MDFEIRIENGQVMSMPERLASGLASLEPLMALIGQRVAESIDHTFAAEGRPDPWQALSPVTLGMKRPGLKILEGETRRLREGIHVEVVGPNFVLVSPDDLPYARIQALGGKTGRGHAVTIPARNYLVLQARDETDINQMILDFTLGRL